MLKLYRVWFINHTSFHAYPYQRYDCPWDKLDVELLEQLVLRLTRTFPEKIDCLKLTLCPLALPSTKEGDDCAASSDAPPHQDHVTIAMDWEVKSYNNLLAKIHESLREVGDVLNGTVRAFYFIFLHTKTILVVTDYYYSFGIVFWYSFRFLPSWLAEDLGLNG